MRVHSGPYRFIAAMIGGAAMLGCGGSADEIVPWGDGGFLETTNDAAPVDPTSVTGRGQTSGSSSSSSSSSGGLNSSGIGGSTSSSSSSSSGGFGGFGSSSGSSSGGGFGSSSGSSSGVHSGSGSSSSSGGGLSSGGGGMDAGTGCPPSSGTAPTWSTIWAMDGFANSCHSCHSQASTASAAYTWLKGKSQINGAASPIATQSSILTIFGGTMPPSGNINAAAKCALVAWAAAGAANN